MTTRTRNRIALGLAAGGVTAVLAACGGSDGNGGSTTTTPPPAGTGATQVDVDLADYRVTLPKQSFEPGVHDFVVKNTGGHDHALVIEGPGGENRSETLEPGASTTLRVTLESGTYEVYCPVDNHKGMGMKTELTVGGAEAPTNEAPTNQPPPPGTGY